MSTRPRLLDTSPPGASRPGAGSDRDQRTVWTPWGTSGGISTMEQEMAFVDHLRRHGDDPFATPSRGDTTACLNALRSGLTVSHLLERCPGLQPARLAAAYSDLEHRRGLAERAWSIIVASGSVTTFAEHAETAAALLPALVGRLVSAARTYPDSFAVTVLRLAETVDAGRRDAYRVEHALARCGTGSARARQLGALLYHPYGDSIATRDNYLPHRVGMLNPTRVAALLGELDSEQPTIDAVR